MRFGVGTQSKRAQQNPNHRAPPHADPLIQLAVGPPGACNVCTLEPRVTAAADNGRPPRVAPAPHVTSRGGGSNETLNDTHTNKGGKTAATKARDKGGHRGRRSEESSIKKWVNGVAGAIGGGGGGGL